MKSVKPGWMLTRSGFSFKEEAEMRLMTQTVELLWVTPEVEKVIEAAGRTCYKSEAWQPNDTGRSTFILQIVFSGHHSVLEHGVASFRIITDRGISHEIVRHRIASYSQESTRYCNYSKNRFQNQCSFILPHGIKGDSAVFEHWLSACQIAEKSYFDLLCLGVAPQIARSVLPTCLKTELVMTANLREWRHFIQLRRAKSSHPQIREIAEMILESLYTAAPSVFEDIYNSGKGEIEHEVE